ncbi:MAG: amylo-alpha-1,6-glucosidase [Synergistaceae bacterium]|nr:amylo-alpha-1,6-glucosidase [Synergistaceae bacterium]
MYLGKADVNTYDKGVEREFLVSNGAGSYGFSTVVGANTRGEHGLLVVRPKGSEKHTVLVSKVEETIYAHNKKYQLSTNRYRDLIYPDGYRYIQEYQGTPFPTLLFVVHSIFLRKSIFMPQNATCTIVKYELAASPEPISIDIRPLFAHRTKEDVTQGGDHPEFTSSVSSDGVVGISGRGYLSHVSFSGAESSIKWQTKPLWFENIVYEKNDISDKPTMDHLWSPGYGSLELRQGDTAYVVLSEEPVAYTPEELEALEWDATEKLGSFVRGTSVDTQHSVVQDMVQLSYHLVADNKGSAPAIFSGFPSVEQRARDTFIALPGLTLTTGRSDTAHRILDNWLEKAVAAGGVMPSLINSGGDVEMGDVDSGLWFLYAVEKYMANGGESFVRNHFKELEEIAGHYSEGSDEFGIKTWGETGLISCLPKSGVKNWMSGEVDGESLVKRKGCLVEINALWYNALRFMERAARLAEDAAAGGHYNDLASKLRESFKKIFWNEAKRYLYDWVDPETGERGDEIRPNAIFAISLPHEVLPDDSGRAVFATCWNELYTTYGLRTLDPHHDKFKGRAEGRQDQRIKARLRGMAWPWLLGHFITAFMKYNPGSYEMGWSFIRPFSSHIRRGCLGGVAEYFDGMMPYRPNGDVISAISQGELLRVMHEDLK